MVLGLNVGGLERVVLRLLEHLDRSRFEPVLIALDEPGALAGELGALGVRFKLLRRRPGLDPRLAVEAARFLADERIQIVHTHNPTPHFYGAVGAALSAVRGGLQALGALGFARPRVVHTKHGRNHPTEPRKVLLNRLASALSDRVVTVSDDARAVAIDIEGVPAEKVVTIANGVDIDELARPRDGLSARAKLGVPSEGFHIGCVARLSPEKDHATLLEAFAALRRRVPDAHLTLVGDGPSRADLLGHAGALGLGASVTFAGMRDDVADVLPAFDVFALASRTEGMSLTLAEAAAAGLPIVATRVGGNPEVVLHGETGLLVPAGAPERFAEALAQIAARGDRRDLGLRGRAHVTARFSVRAMARAYEALYEELCLGLGAGGRATSTAPVVDTDRNPHDVLARRAA